MRNIIKCLWEKYIKKNSNTIIIPKKTKYNKRILLKTVLLFLLRRLGDCVGKGNGSSKQTSCCIDIL